MTHLEKLKLTLAEDTLLYALLISYQDDLQKEIVRVHKEIENIEKTEKQ